MSRIFNLNNKLIKVEHKISKEKFVAMNIPQDKFENEVKSELIRQLAIHVMKTFPIDTHQPKHNNDNFRWDSKGYILSERQMLEVIIEICEYDDKMRDIIANSSRVELSNMI